MQRIWRDKNMWRQHIHTDKKRIVKACVSLSPDRAAGMVFDVRASFAPRERGWMHLSLSLSHPLTVYGCLCVVTLISHISQREPACGGPGLWDMCFVLTASAPQTLRKHPVASARPLPLSPSPPLCRFASPFVSRYAAWPETFQLQLEFVCAERFRPAEWNDLQPI